MLVPRRLLNIRPDALNNSCTETCQVKQEARIPSHLRFLMRGSHGLESRPLTCFASLCSSLAGCTFDEDSNPSLCEFSQGEEDDFDWQLFRAHASPHSTSDLLRGKSAQRCPFLFHQFISHCGANRFTPVVPSISDALLPASSE